MTAKSHTIRRTLVATEWQPYAAGIVERRNGDIDVSLEVVGGPPLTMVDVVVGESCAARVFLDAYGGTSIERVTAQPGYPIEIRVGAETILRGHVPQIYGGHAPAGVL